ncbi:uncharacterized protein LOC111081537 [Drosophila obscura]|uniref:uncharacterized protein LOC111081537 n=1 Tax=Drosophila obscura TaxID=7282 RepID=UPI001BB2C4F1|nr:uncharacterized protein LOC111081537 [Drosophila obscura]
MGHQGSVACSGSGISYVQCQNLKYNVIILGWLGVIVSSVTLGSSMVTLHMHPDIGLLLKQGLFSLAADNEQQFLMNLLTIFSSVAYGLSLINAAVSLLLLIGVARDTSWLMYPWLIFHGVIYGFGLYLGVFYATVGLFIDLSSFLMCLLVFTLVLVIFYKIYHEVFTLFRVMGEQSKHATLGGVCCKDAEYGVPCQQVYVPLKQ